MSMRVVYLLSGQGSQHVGMGRALLTRLPGFARRAHAYDDAVRPLVGRSLLDLLGSGDDGWLSDTALTHPAICLLELCAADCLANAGIHADAVLGASLGHIAGLGIAGAVAPATALRWAALQGLIVQRHCAANGALLAVLAEPHTVGDYSRLGLTLAAVNHPQHFLLAGPRDAIDQVSEALTGRRILCQRLATRHAFHSGHIDAAREPFLDAIAADPIAPPSAAIRSALDGVHRAEPAHEDAWTAVRERVDFARAVQDIERDGGAVYVDLGPSGTLAGFVRRQLPEGSASRVHAVFSLFGNEDKHWDALCAAIASPLKYPQQEGGHRR